MFSIAGTVKRADIKEDKDGKSRGMGTVTFEQAIEAVQAICILIYSLVLSNTVEELDTILWGSWNLKLSGLEICIRL